MDTPNGPSEQKPDTSSKAVKILKILITVAILAAAFLPQYFATHRKRGYLHGVALSSFNLGEMKMVMTHPTTHLNCTIWLGYSYKYDENGSEFTRELETKRQKLRGISYRVIGNKTLEELQEKNLDKLEKELKGEINKVLENGSVRNIMFEKYVLQ